MIEEKWGEMILNGEKTLEIRRGHCRKHAGERIGLCYSGTSCIYGYVDFVQSIGPLTADDWRELRDKHCVPGDAMRYGAKTCGWVMRNPERCLQPFEIQRAGGAVIWQSVEDLEDIMPLSEFMRMQMAGSTTV